MSVEFLSAERLAKLLDAANNATGAADTTLTAAISRLISGYGVASESQSETTAILGVAVLGEMVLGG